ncbi:histidinol-phosphate aminotransferase [Nitratiruptor sp. YY08-26]|uniref:histidinol-phosphate transaminase n=1 Tax=unclassified Nitratiruptor TaxID=2624044 RepID=UPI001915BBCD|nr:MULTISPECIES: histidinol-phosphate transaminase [unclassified Nitratiruptor]BCD61574.1 histidinol-phosphate aminotransferase [Nitratiruptor sp. YY08-13]BCD65508.1 histidinol-phosphate aminotransferase [Nitratiruptor sp. YY08-26]
MRFNENLQRLKTYEAGKPIELVVREYGIDEKDIIKLASNENPYGTSPKVVKKVQENAHKMYLYPDDSMFELKATLAKRFGASEEEIIIGAGSDQVLEFCARAVLNEHTSVLMSKITFAMYEIYALQQGSKIIRSSCYRHDLDEFYDLYQKHNPSIVHICTPNNPTGDAIDREYLYSFLEKVKDPLVVVDGAYMEYAAYKDPKKLISPRELIAKYPNAIYLGTFSKAYGLGGMRVGYGIAQKEIIQQLYKLRPPFNITTLSLLAATEALKDEEFVQRAIEKNFSQMDRFIHFAMQNELEFIDSYTNFITYLLPQSINAKDLANALLRRGIIVRDLSSYGMNALRITIGTPEQNSIFFEKCKEVFDEYKR